MSLNELAGLFAAAAAGGAINAVAGGGTLITFPTLLAFGTPPVVANATSTLALVIGTSGSIFGYRQHLAAVRGWLWRFIPVSVLGGLVGALLLTWTSNRTFAKLVPFLILFATILFLAQGVIRRVARPAAVAPSHACPSYVVGAMFFQFLIAVYGGYFGAGIGILMLATLGFIGLAHIHEMNTLKTILGSLINLVAALWFALFGLIDWPKATVMLAGAVLGYFFGSIFAQRISQRHVRCLIAVIGLVLSAWTFYQEFGR